MVDAKLEFDEQQSLDQALQDLITTDVVDDTLAESFRNAALEEAALIVDRLWDECVRDRPHVNIYRKTLDNCLRNTAKEIRAAKREVTHG